MRLIDADLLVNDLVKLKDEDSTEIVNNVIYIIDTQPTLDYIEKHK